MTAEWIAVDWGSSHLRVWAMAADGTAWAERRSDQGTGQLATDQFEPALLALIRDWLDGPTQVIACGMVGARQGWAEAGYADAPCRPPSGSDAKRAPTQDARLSVHIIPGIRQTRQPDVMRGEETQIAGFLRRDPGFDGVLCLPGTHSKWAQISAGEVVSFRSFMTGELFALLSRHSVLRHTLSGSGWDDAAFAEGVTDAMARPALLSSDLFALRAAQLVRGESAAATWARLSGLLVGLELLGARPYWLGQNVAIIGDRALSQRYASALAAQGLPAEIHDGDAMVLAGLGAAQAQLKGTVT